MNTPSEKKCIVFVDDEPEVLEALERMLHGYREEWEMYFFVTAHAALEFMKTETVDVVVTDLKMPEMDGAQFLNIVKEQFPNVVRFVLSGYSDKQMIMKTVGATDQFLSKPCEPNILKEAINGALEAQQLVEERKLRSMVSGLRTLPTLPDLYVKLKAVINSPRSSFQDIAGIIKQDVTVMAKVLQLVNSAFFGLKHRIDNIQHAMAYLGIETLKALVLTTDIFSRFSQSEIDEFHVRELYQHSLFVGAVARKIVETVSQDTQFVDEVSMAGMLHDIGKVILIRNKPAEYKEIHERFLETGSSFYVLEKTMLGTSHADLGAYLMTLWGLPGSIVKAIGFHHNPFGMPQTVFGSVSAVYIANILVHKVEDNVLSREKLQLDPTYVYQLKVESYLPQWEKITIDAVKHLRATSELF